MCELKVMSYADRAQHCSHDIARQIFTIMDQKKTNLAFAADVTTCQELLDVRTVQLCTVLVL